MISLELTPGGQPLLSGGRFANGRAKTIRAEQSLRSAGPNLRQDQREAWAVVATSLTGRRSGQVCLRTGRPSKPHFRTDHLMDGAISARSLRRYGRGHLSHMNRAPATEKWPLPSVGWTHLPNPWPFEPSCLRLRACCEGAFALKSIEKGACTIPPPPKSDSDLLTQGASVRRCIKRDRGGHKCGFAAAPMGLLVRSHFQVNLNQRPRP